MPVLPLERGCCWYPSALAPGRTPSRLFFHALFTHAIFEGWPFSELCDRGKRFCRPKLRFLSQEFRKVPRPQQCDSQRPARISITDSMKSSTVKKETASSPTRIPNSARSENDKWTNANDMLPLTRQHCNNAEKKRACLKGKHKKTTVTRGCLLARDHWLPRIPLRIHDIREATPLESSPQLHLRLFLVT